MGSGCGFLYRITACFGKYSQRTLAPQKIYSGPACQSLIVEASIECCILSTRHIPPLLQIVYIIRLDTNRNCCVYVMILENNRNCGVYVIRLENNRNCCSNNTYIKYIVKQYGSEGLYNDITYLYSWDFYNVHDTHKLRISILSWMNTFNCPCQHE